MYKYKHTLNECSARSGKKSWECIQGFSILKYAGIFLTSAVSFSFQTIYTHFQSWGESYMWSEKPLAQIKGNEKEQRQSICKDK